MWYGPFVISKVLEKGAYKLVEYDGIHFRETSQWVVPEEVLCLDLSWIVSCIYVYYLTFSVLNYFQYGFGFSICIY